MEPPFIFPPPTTRFEPRGHSRSSSRSPTRPRFTDDVLADLSPATTLEAFTSSSGALRASIEAASPTQRAFGIRAAIASKKIQEWVTELSTWQWPSGDSRGFELPEAKRRKTSVEESINLVNGSCPTSQDTASTEDGEYWGSLRAKDVMEYECRIDDIAEDMDDLNVEEIKSRILDTHVLPKSRPSSSHSTVPPPPHFTSYTRMDDFTAVVTATVLQCLPNLSRLMRLMNVWSVRLAVLRDVKPLMLALVDAEAALILGWEALDSAPRPEVEVSGLSLPDESVLSRHVFDAMQDSLQNKVTRLGQRLDRMLDTLEGREDTIPDAWLDRMERIEQDYGEWAVAGDRRVREGEWAIEMVRRKEEDVIRLSVAQEEVHNTALEQQLGELDNPTATVETPLVTVSATATNNLLADCSEANHVPSDLPGFIPALKASAGASTQFEGEGSSEAASQCPVPDTNPLLLKQVQFIELVPHVNDHVATDAINDRRHSLATLIEEEEPLDVSVTDLPQLQSFGSTVSPFEVLPTAQGPVSSDFSRVLRETDPNKVFVPSRPTTPITKEINKSATPSKNGTSEKKVSTPYTPTPSSGSSINRAVKFPSNQPFGNSFVEDGGTPRSPTKKAKLDSGFGNQSRGSVSQVASLAVILSDPLGNNTSSPACTLEVTPQPLSSGNDQNTKTLENPSQHSIAVIPGGIHPVTLGSEYRSDFEGATVLNPADDLHIVPDSPDESYLSSTIRTPPRGSSSKENSHSRNNSFASSISGYVSSEPSPEIIEAEPTTYFRPVLSPIKTINYEAGLATPTQFSLKGFLGEGSELNLFDDLGTSLRTVANEQTTSPVFPEESSFDLTGRPSTSPSSGESETGSEPFSPTRSSLLLTETPLGPSIKKSQLSRNGSQSSTTSTVIDEGLSSDFETPSKLASSKAGIPLFTPVRRASPKTEFPSNTPIIDCITYSLPEYEEESPSIGHVKLHRPAAVQFSPGSSPPAAISPIRRCRSLQTVSTPYHDNKLLTPETPATPPIFADAPMLANIGISAAPLRSPAKSTQSQLELQISEILESIPARITLATEASESPYLAPLQVKKQRKSSGSSFRPTLSRASTPTPSFTLAPAYGKNPRQRPQNGNPEIKVYHLSRSTGEAPIKLFVRLVGEHGERVMVRVGGGWADLGEYLKEYASHHGRRSEKPGKVEIQDIPPRVVSTSSISSRSGAVSRNGRSSPVSRPGSSLDRPMTSLAMRKTRKSVGDETGYRSPSTPLPIHFSRPTTTPNSVGNDFSTPPSQASRTRSLSTTWSEDGNGESELGLAGPRGRKSDMSPEKMAWVESMKEKVRVASAEKEKEQNREFGKLGRVGGTKRLFKKGP